VKFKALQNDHEFRAFAELMRGENVRSYLEIGSKFGGSLWLAAEVMPKGSRIVAVDTPNPKTNGHLHECGVLLCQRGFDVHLIIADSTDHATVDRVSVLGPYDVCFIDANHTLPYLSRDWDNYGPLARIVAFHDIGWDMAKNQTRLGHLPIEVPAFWNELKANYQHKEIKVDEGNNGIGVLWH